VNGTAIDQNTYTGAKNQIWLVVSEGNGRYELVNENSGLALEVPGWLTTAGTLLDQWTVNGGANQLWTLK
jgi:arabinan endo-1,5-alpha-L-arabinosidase